LIPKKDKFECNKCQIIVESKESLNLHKEENHPLIKCYYNECSYETNDEKCFKRHEFNHLKPKKYKCVWNECDKSLLLVKIYINIRLMNTIEITAIGVFGSNVAKDSVKSQFYLDKHKLRHTGFRCKHKNCDQTFTHLVVLRFHSKHICISLVSND
jgi:hypothetical protein